MDALFAFGLFVLLSESGRSPVWAAGAGPLGSDMRVWLVWTVVVAAWYGGAGSVYDGQPLYCAGAEGPVYKVPSGAQVGIPRQARNDRWEGAAWVAVDVGMYERGEVVCGDELAIRFGDGEEVRALALDAGTFAGHWIEDWPEVPIGVDFPAHRWGRDEMTALVEVRNVSKGTRAMEDARVP